MRAAAALNQPAGANQALALLLALQIPILPLISLVPNLPQLMAHFASARGSAFLVPMIITVPSIGIAVLAPLAGALADRWGRRRLLLSALALFSVASLTPLIMDDLRYILLAQTVVGIGEAIIMTVANTLLGDYFEPVAQRRWLGMQNILGPIVASVLTLSAGALGTISWRAPFLMNLLAVVALAWIWLATWEPRRATAIAGGERGSVNDFPWRTMAIIWAVTLLTSLLYFVAVIHLGLIFAGLGAASPATISVLIMLCNIGTIAAGYYFRNQQRTIPGNLALLYLAVAVGLIGMGLSGGYRVGLPFAIMLYFGTGLVVPLLLSWALRSLDDVYRGRGMGIWMSCFFCGQFICPPLTALLIQASNGILHAIIIIGAASLLLAAVAYIVMLGSRERPAAMRAAAASD